MMVECEAGCHLLAQKDKIITSPSHLNTLTTSPPPHPNPQYSNSHSNSRTAEVIQVCENTSKMSTETDKKLLTALIQTCFRFQGQGNCNDLIVYLKKMGKKTEKNYSTDKEFTLPINT